MAYKYKLAPRPPDVPKNRLRTSTQDENLTSIVQGQKASEYEERFANALSKMKLDFHFQVVMPTNYQIPGQLNTIDFLVVEGLEYPVEIDGDWVHKNGSQHRRDEIRDAIINAQMMPQGWQPIQRISGHRLETQEDADRVAREMF